MCGCGGVCLCAQALALETFNPNTDTVVCLHLCLCEQYIWVLLSSALCEAVCAIRPVFLWVYICVCMCVLGINAQLCCRVNLQTPPSQGRDPGSLGTMKSSLGVTGGSVSLQHSLEQRKGKQKRYLLKLWFCYSLKNFSIRKMYKFSDK